MDLTFDINNQIIKRTDNLNVVNMSQDYLKLIFTFKTDDWTGLTDYYIFFKASDGDYRFALEIDSEAQGLVCYITVPSIVLTGKKFIFGLVGEEDGTVRITTNLILIRLLDSKFTDGGVDILERIDELYEIKIDKVDIVDDLTTDDNTKVLSAKQGKTLKTLVDTKADSGDMASALAGKSDVGHKHAKSDITDFGHTHTKSEITDFAHNHDDRYYTESETDTLLNGKVDKVNGKGLSANDYTNADKTIVGNVTSNLAGKVDKIQGKGLSSNDFTNAYKAVLDTFDGDFSEIVEEHLDDVIDELTNETFYTKTEVDALLSAKDNQIILEANKPIIQLDETLTLTAYVKKNGVPVYNERVEFYIENDDEEDEE